MSDGRPRPCPVQWTRRCPACGAHEGVPCRQIDYRRGVRVVIKPNRELPFPMVHADRKML